MKYFKITNNCKKTNWRSFQTCEHCLDKYNSSYKRDWFLKVEETPEEKCEHTCHNHEMKRLNYQGKSK